MVTTKSLSTWGSHSYRKFVYHIKWAAGFASMTTKLSNKQTQLSVMFICKAVHHKIADKTYLVQ